MCDGRRRQEPRQRINCLIESRGNNMNNNNKVKATWIMRVFVFVSPRLAVETWLEHTKWWPSYFGGILKVTTWAAIIISAFISCNYSSPLPRATHHYSHVLSLFLSLSYSFSFSLYVSFSLSTSIYFWLFVCKFWRQLRGTLKPQRARTLMCALQGIQLSIIPSCG